MGMRATFAHIDLQGTLNMVSVQWSTMIDQNLSLALKDHKAPEKALSRIFKKVTTSYDHISSLDMEAKNYAGDDNDHMGYGLYVTRGVPKTDDLRSRYTAFQAEKAGGYMALIEGYHTSDGLSVIIDQRDPEHILFGWVDGEVHWEQVKVKDLIEGGKNNEDGYKSTYHMN